MTARRNRCVTEVIRLVPVVKGGLNVPLGWTWRSLQENACAGGNSR